jgi:asparagine synthetase B (glutamine-hydrolysing)
MCGIWIVIRKNKNSNFIDSKFKNNIKNRGPDKTIEGEIINYGIDYVFYRLSIEDLSNNVDQPFKYETD